MTLAWLPLAADLDTRGRAIQRPCSTQAVVLSARDWRRRREHARHIAAPSALMLPSHEHELNAVVAGYARIPRTTGSQDDRS